jgi:hypothetical protein
MDIKEEFDALIAETRETVKEQIKGAFIDGAKAGAIGVCRTLYETFTAAGLEQDNILFLMLKDIAKANGCEDLVKYCEERRAEANTNILN